MYVLFIKLTFLERNQKIFSVYASTLGNKSVLGAASSDNPPIVFIALNRVSSVLGSREIGPMLVHGSILKIFTPLDVSK